MSTPATKNLRKGWKYYAVFALSVIFLSRWFAAWRSMSVLQLSLFGVLFLMSMIYLVFVNYQIEREKGKVVHPVRIFEKWLKS